MIMQTIKQSILKLLARKNLSCHESESMMLAILRGQVNHLQAMAFLLLLHAKSVTLPELLGLIYAMRNMMVPVTLACDVCDIVGTGGDGAGTVNISTGSAILAASCGIKILKHGNRAISSMSGSADVLEALGININQNSEQICQSLENIGIGFCLSPNFHPATKTISSLRRELSVPTVLNIIGPLIHPANPGFQMIGVYDEKLLHLFADVIAAFSFHQRAIVFHGCGLDEISCLGPLTMIEVSNKHKKILQLDCDEVGLPRCSLADLKGGDAVVNAARLTSALLGEDTEKGLTNTLILNAAVALYLTYRVPTIAAGVTVARDHVFSGNAYQLLQQWKAHSYANA